MQPTISRGAIQELAILHIADDEVLASLTAKENGEHEAVLITIRHSRTLVWLGRSGWVLRPEKRPVPPIREDPRRNEYNADGTWGKKS